MKPQYIDLLFKTLSVFVVWFFFVFVLEGGVPLSKAKVSKGENDIMTMQVNKTFIFVTFSLYILRSYKLICAFDLDNLA